MQETSKETGEVEIDIGELFRVLIHKIWIIILTAFVFGAAILIYTVFLTKPQYQSTTKVYILNKQDSGGSVTYSDVQLSSTLSKDYEQLVTSRYVI